MPQRKAEPVGPHILCPAPTIQSAPSCCTSMGLPGTDWQQSKRTLALTCRHMTGQIEPFIRALLNKGGVIDECNTDGIRHEHNTDGSRHKSNVDVLMASDMSTTLMASDTSPILMATDTSRIMMARDIASTLTLHGLVHGTSLCYTQRYSAQDINNSYSNVQLHIITIIYRYASRY